MSQSVVREFISLLKNSPGAGVFNPWWRIDCTNDVGREAATIRRRHLEIYLKARLNTAHTAIIGEALGYRGGHFTGIAMTSERILVGRSPRVDVDPKSILPGLVPRRTSKPAICRDGFSEPTATIVWSALLQLGLRPSEFVLWNAFPWHSFDPPRGMLSNRMPNEREVAAGLPILRKFLWLFSFHKIVALGRIAHQQLIAIGVNSQRVRHPASGGAKLFREQIAQIIRSC